MGEARLHVVRLGSRSSTSAAPVVLLHGFMGTHRVWRHLGRELATSTHRACLAIDLPGHGKSPLPTAPLTLQLAAELVGDALASAGIERPWLVGYSLGGRIALAAALSGAELSGLVLESTHPGIGDPRQRIERATLDDQRAARLASDFETFLRHWYEAPLFASLAARPMLLTEVKNERRRGDPRALARVLAELSPGRQPPRWDQLSSLQAPTHILVGDQDAKYLDVGRRMVQCCGSAALHVVPNAGHNVHVEQPGLWLHLLRTFLTGL